MPLVVDTRPGRIRGRLDRGVTAFRGVPYGRAPVGSLRFAAPVPVEPWPDVRDCVDPAPSAPQIRSRFSAVLGERAEKQSEDCLALDLWSAGFDGVPRPVLVFVHGGDFAEGSIAEPAVRGRRLARGGDLVVVSLQYRLGALGFFAPNLGLLDLVAGLEWVRDEIDAFGGDANRVTLFGHGAGATAVACLMAMPRAQGLFQRAILASGRYAVDSAETADKRRADYLRTLELLPADGAKLGALPLEELLAAQLRRGGFRPVVDGTVLPQAPLDAIRTGAASAIPLLVGGTRDETRILDLVEPSLRSLSRMGIVTRLVEEGVTPEAAAAAAGAEGASAQTLFHRTATEQLYRLPARAIADAHSARAPVFQYRFDLSGSAGGSDTGAFHGLDLPLVFGTRRIAPLGRFFEDVPEAKPVGRRMRDAFAAFASAGDPRSPLLGAWPRYTAAERTIYAFNASE